MSERVDKLIEIATDAVGRAKKAGAEIAEAVAADNAELSTKVRLGKPELVQEAHSRGLGLRVFKDGREATTFTSDLTDGGVETMVHDAIELAALGEADPLAGPPDPGLLAKSRPDLELFDSETHGIDAGRAVELAIEGEDAARAFDPRITNSDGSTFSRDASARALVTSGGFSGGYESSYASLYVSPVADDADGKKQNGYFWDARRYFSDLRSAKEVGDEAARRTLRKLGADKVPTTEAPVVFDPDAGRALLSLLFSCVSGSAIYKRSSYLLDKEGQQIANPMINIVDDPLVPRGPGSRPFDGEGLASRRNVVVKDGVLETYLVDTYTGRKLGRESTGSAARGTGGRPSVAPTNFHMVAGETDPEAILGGVERGLYVTSMMGFGFNAVTGDFSRGAEGFWIEKGQPAQPVSGVTISLNFNELWKRVDAVGSDLELKTRFATPTFRVSQMTIAGT